MIIIKPVITEKTIRMAEELNQYTFIVSKNSNKHEIASEVEKQFKVKVIETKTSNVLGKKVIFGKQRRPGAKQSYKKAIVSLKSGDNIDLFKIK